MKHEVPEAGTLNQISYCRKCGAGFSDTGPCPGITDQAAYERRMRTEPLPRSHTPREAWEAHERQNEERDRLHRARTDRDRNR
jgi:hypothetical protein